MNDVTFSSQNVTFQFRCSGANALRAFESARASERGLGDCAHARDVVRARASMTSVARALFL